MAPAEMLELTIVAFAVFPVKEKLTIVVCACMAPSLISMSQASKLYRSVFIGSIVTAAETFYAD